MGHRRKVIIPVGELMPTAAAAAIADNTYNASAGGKAQAEEQRRWDNAKVGEVMPDKTIYAGISPDTHKRMYAAPKDAPILLDFNQAAKYAEDLEVGGRKGFRVPSKAELNVLFKNKDKGALKDAFNVTGSLPAGWYWSGTPGNVFAWGQWFGDGGQNYVYRHSKVSVRCVR